MNSNKIDSVGYYMARYPDSILLFLIDNHYEAYDIDRFPGLRALCEDSSGSVARFPAEGILDVVARLSSMGYDSKVIVSRNGEGVHDFPDVARMTQEQEDDY